MNVLSLLKVVPLRVTQVLRLFASVAVGILVSVILSYSIAPVLNGIVARFIGRFGADFSSVVYWSDIATTMLAFFIGGLLAYAVCREGRNIAVFLVGLLGFLLAFQAMDFDFRHSKFADEHGLPHSFQLTAHLLGALFVIRWGRSRKSDVSIGHRKNSQIAWRQMAINSTVFILGLLFLSAGYIATSYFSTSNINELSISQKAFLIECRWETLRRV